MSAFQGIVASVKNQKTAIVVVRRRARHPMYGKSITRTRRYPVHDLVGVAVGDKVEFVPCRPVSKTKRWKVTKVIDGKEGATEKSKAKKSRKTTK